MKIRENQTSSPSQLQRAATKKTYACRPESFAAGENSYRSRTGWFKYFIGFAHHMTLAVIVSRKESYSPPSSSFALYILFLLSSYCLVRTMQPKMRAQY